jgi:hypothetical protein
MPAPRSVELLVSEMEQLCRVYESFESADRVAGPGNKLNRQLLSTVIDELMSLYSEAKSHGPLDDATSLRILACMQTLASASRKYINA